MPTFKDHLKNKSKKKRKARKGDLAALMKRLASQTAPDKLAAMRAHAPPQPVTVNIQLPPQPAPLPAVPPDSIRERAFHTTPHVG